MRTQGSIRPVLALLVLVAAAAGLPGHAQVPPYPLPLPPPPREEADETAPTSEFLEAEDRGPWPGLPIDLAESFANTAERYREHAVRFTCFETVRAARYDDGEASKEETRRYGYLLERPGDTLDVREVRQKLRGDRVTGAEVKDEEAFPPAYAWVFLFSRFHQPYFSYRVVEERFEGFDFVVVVRFRGALPYTDGKDIRQWEGTAVVDAFTHAPIEIVAEPSRQRERLRVLFDRWSRAFNIVGLRTAPRPFGYRCRVSFLLRQERLSFPTELRYDTFRAVNFKATIPWSASIRTYEDYRFFRADTIEKPGGTAP